MNRISKYFKSIICSGILLLAILFFIACEPAKEEVKLNVIYKNLDSAQAIIPISDSLVIPIVYTNVIPLGDLPVEEKKQKFIDMMLPAILVAKHKLEKNRERVHQISIDMNHGKMPGPDDKKFIDSLFFTFAVDDYEALDRRLQTHPVSIVLGQAIIECGWGTSRFFQSGNNVFGVWSFNPDENRIKAFGQRAGGKNIYVKSYKDLTASIQDYFRILGKLDAYKKFRGKRVESQDPFEMIPYLHNYSELGTAYTKKLERIIKHNNLTRYDHYRLDPDFFADPKENLFAQN